MSSDSSETCLKRLRSATSLRELAAILHGEDQIIVFARSMFEQHPAGLRDGPLKIRELVPERFCFGQFLCQAQLSAMKVARRCH